MNIDQKRFLLIAGPCVVEGKQICLDVAGRILEICNKLDVTFVFKASYRKANRSSIHSFTGLGDDLAIQILKDVKAAYDIPIITDIHESQEAEKVGKVVDILQIPAFLCRQTELIQAAARHSKIVNIKKGQFLGPEAMKFAVEKVKEVSDADVWLTERGSFFGYQDLVVDFRAIPIMQRFASKVILDCTHSLQQPNPTAGVTGGLPQLIGTMARAGTAVGVDGLFIETHPNPSKALSDGANMLQLDKLEPLLESMLHIRRAIS